ncbi:pectate lyase family protein [Aquisediminimonas sediminicola]|uniref:pectate lyase family protein n=1 Tax=Alteraquisediminimonas sediminicola TaxID=2676787 RepID=UPI001C8D97AA|nr:hypothetical protein [Aquisediminimonas sediminicola]
MNKAHFPALMLAWAGKALAASTPVPAFPDAEGYGAFAARGRGGTVLHVTSLKDDGPGSLRWALEQQTGPRIVIFDVAGTITLTRQILVTSGRLTIAGQSAPGEGITLKGARIRLKASDIIIRGLHFRPGDGPIGQPFGERDGLMIGTTDFVLSNIMIDHNSFSWGIDENVSINGKVENISFSHNIVAQGLSRNGHPKGEHSKGLLIANWQGDEADARRISVIKNLFADNIERNPEVRAGHEVEIVNNLIANHGRSGAAMAVGGGSLGSLTLRVMMIGNVMLRGPSTTGNDPPIAVNAMTSASRITLKDNIRLPHRSTPQDQRALAHGEALQMPGLIVTQGGSPAHVTPLRSGAVKAYVLTHAGAMTASGRDRIDRQIVQQVIDNNGRIIDRPPVLSAVPDASPPAPADTDRDGMPDWFEHRYGLNPASPDDQGEKNKDGFTHIEVYLNGLIDGFKP